MAKPVVLQTRSLIILCGGVIAAFLLCAQAVSNAIASPYPALASELNPSNGIALEKQAFKIFSSNAASEADFLEAASKARPIARSSLKFDPLSPRAYTIMALSEPNDAVRQKIIEYASATNRRDSALQGLVLSQHLAAGDYEATINTVDQLQRASIRVRETLFPVLVDAMKQPGSETRLANLLDLSTPWHEQFLLFVLDAPEARLVIASARNDFVIDDSEFDRRLIFGLAQQGELDVARRLYTRVRQLEANKTTTTSTSWPSEFPPFDWNFTSTPDLRAQPSRDNERLELFARAGAGGPAAQRHYELLQDDGIVTFDVDTALPLREGAIRFVANCANGNIPITSVSLSRGANNIAIKQQNSECGQMKVAIYVRARRGEPALRAELSKLVFKPG